MNEPQTASVSTEQAPNSTENTSNVAANTENTAPNTQINDNTQQKDTRTEPNGFDRVDFTPEQQARFDRLYGQVKAQDRKYNEALEVMRTQSEVIAELQKGVGNVVQHLNTQEINNQEESATAEAEAAFAKGDSKGYLAAMRKVAQIEAQKIARQNTQQNQQVRQPQQVNSASDVANRAVQQGLMSPNDQSAFEAWQDERDQTGNPVRPWAKRETAGDAFDSALMRSAGVFADPKFRNAPIEQKLAEVDRIIGVSRGTPTQNVMGANLTQKGKTNNVKVSADMERVLNHLRPRGPKAKNAPDPVAWYREQAVKAKTHRGTTR